MIKLAYGVMAIWIAGYLCLQLRGFNLGRLVLNQLAPGEAYRDVSYWSIGIKRGLGTTTDPKCLTELGRELQKRAIRNEYVAYGWLAGGGILVLSFLAYVHA
jgi:hypothetical protein